MIQPAHYNYASHTGDKQTMMAVCLADPDHPASYDPILGQAFADFFKKDNPKDRTIMQFCDYLQVLSVC